MIRRHRQTSRSFLRAMNRDAEEHIAHLQGRIALLEHCLTVACVVIATYAVGMFLMAVVVSMEAL